MLTNFKALINGFVSKDKSKVLSNNIFTFASVIGMQKGILQSVKKYGGYIHFYVTFRSRWKWRKEMARKT